MVNLQVNHRSVGKKSHTREGRAFLPGNGACFNMLHSTKKLSPFCAVATGTTATHARVGSTCRSQTLNQFLESTNFLCSGFPLIHNPFFPLFISGGSPPLLSLSFSSPVSEQALGIVSRGRVLLKLQHLLSGKEKRVSEKRIHTSFLFPFFLFKKKKNL